MTDEFAALTDEKLKFWFSIEFVGSWTPDALAILHELERRGYLFDDRYRDFVTCEGWNKRHGDWSPRDCAQKDAS